MTWTPWHHQQYTIDKFHGTDQGGLDFSDPGTGKTATWLELFNRSEHGGRMLVSCPTTLMRSAWGNDLDKYFPGLTYSVADAKHRFDAFKQRTDVVIINTDGVKAITQEMNTPTKLRRFFEEFSHFTIDESTGYKHQSSARSKAAYKISRAIPIVNCLSGTPNPKSVTELWHQVMLVDNGQRLGPNFFRFRNAMQEAEQIGPQANHLAWKDKPQANELVMYLLRDIMVRHAFEEVMTDVPANHVDHKWVDLPPKLRTQYMVLEEQLSLMAGEAVIGAVHAAALRTKLLQLCSGAVYAEDGSYVVLDNYRYEMVADMVEETKHSVTFFNWKHQKEELAKAFAKRDISFAIIDGDVPQAERGNIVADYQAGKYQTLLIHPKTGAHGLTLTRGTRCFIVSPMYEPDYFKQTIHRIYRGGQTEVTNTVLVGARGTVEEKVYNILMTDGARMSDFLSMVADLKKER